MDRYTALKSFVSIAEFGSFSKAAELAGVTPIIMSRRLSELEKQLGITLVHRSTRGITLTHLGEEYWQLCRDAIKTFEQVEETMKGGNSRISGVLKVSAPAGFGRKHVAPHINQFLSRYPEIHFSLNLTDRVQDLVKEGFDVAVRIGGEIDGNYVRRVLYPNHRVVCGAPAYFAQHERPKKPEDLAKHNCLTISPWSGQTQGWVFRDPAHRGKELSVRVRGNIDCNEGEMLYLWAKQGLGLVWRSAWEVHHDVSNGALVTVLDRYAIPDHDILAVYPSQTHLPKKVRCFIDFLKETYQEQGYWDRHY